MQLKGQQPFWGEVDVLHSSLQLTPKECTVFGADDPGPRTAQAKDIQRTVESTMQDLNARQICAKLRAGNGNLVDPPPMQAVEGAPPDQVSIYTDGGVQFPNRQDLALGGFGIWIPKSSVQDDQHDHIVQGTANLMIWQKWTSGTALWAPMYGVWYSSARTELMGLITAMLLPIPVHVGIDNSTVVNNFHKLEVRGMEEN